MPPQFDPVIYATSIWVIPLIIAITFHEAAHGYVARFFGDNTAWQFGRLTLNPFKHIDPIGTILLPALLFLTRSPFLFGYAKPVPVDFRALRNPRRHMVWVAAAGPGTNIVLAVFAAEYRWSLGGGESQECAFDQRISRNLQSVAFAAPRLRAHRCWLAFG